MKAGWETFDVLSEEGMSPREPGNRDDLVRTVDQVLPLDNTLEGELERGEVNVRLDYSTDYRQAVSILHIYYTLHHFTV